MNRIILIGNGFDLAHGLKTSYQDFLDSYWINWMNKLDECQDSYLSDEFYEFSSKRGLPLASDKFFPIGFITKSFDEISIYPELNNSIPIRWNACKSFIDIVKLCNTVNEHSIKEDNVQRIDQQYKSHLFNAINKAYLTKWVDIENEYYQYLISLISPSNDNKWTQISDLNNEFSKIKNELEVYLDKILKSQEIKPNYIIQKIISSNFDIRDFTEDGIRYFAESRYREVQNFFETTPEDTCLTKGLIERYEDYKYFSIMDFKRDLLSTSIESKVKQIELKPDQILFLNFNYTNLEKLYMNETENQHEIIHIHGELNNSMNPIIFGYGDELSKEYMEIENLNNNDFLENIKSINYLGTDNYKKLLNFIESDKYQIFILGHSCGNSDRTLLNTLFEHENCVSIKPYYYRKKDGTDNYNDIIKNISRNFSNKASMRDKVVNKMYCKPFVGNHYCDYDDLPF